jgi:cytochrome P450
MAEPFVFQPLDPATRRDPFALYARGRREQPAFAHAGLPLRVVSVFRHADVQAILRDADAFSNVFQLQALAPEAAPGVDVRPPSMLGTDPPEHTRLRSLVGKAFTPRIVQRLEGRMREVTESLLDEALAKRDVDLVEALTYPLPVTVIAEIIGIPAEDRARFKAWSDQAVANLGVAFMSGIDPERIRRQLALFEEMSAYLVPLAEERRREPREDLLTGLVRAEHEGSKLSHAEMISMVVLLLVAGNETTTTLIGNAVQELVAHPAEQERLRAEPELLPRAIEEVLRFASPVQFAPRRAKRATELHGVAIRENDAILCWIGSANRDESVFERPERFDVARDPNPHVSFGFGIHYCLGANLARLEARVAIGALLRRTRRIALDEDGPLPLHPSPVFRAVTRLPVRLEPARSG